ncbi:DMT family transporter [Desulfitibacter alkalitolerans]|uniref:DMT family transporter n=1 Tax=Desulfitibacter alkalitolerans TaxID=264641 RepID=UPI0004813762|nr:DMT family transporter [Desulfitibacter alkalitolerans]
MTGLLSTFLSAFSNGVYLTVNRTVLLNTSPIVFGFLVMGTVGVLLALYSIYKYGFQEFKNAIKTNLTFLLLMGIIASTLNFLLFWGLQLSTATNSAIITRLDVLFAAILGGIFFGERLKGWDWAAVIILIFGSLRVLQIDISQFTANKGDILFIIHTFLVAVNAQIIRYKLAEVKGSIKACFNAGSCSLIYLTVIILTGQTQQLAVAMGEHTVPIGVSIMLLTFQYPTYYYGLQMLETWTVRSIFLVMLLTSSMSSYFLLGEHITGIQIQGMILVSAGVLLLSYNQKLKGEKDARLLKCSRPGLFKKNNNKETFFHIKP